MASADSLAERFAQQLGVGPHTLVRRGTATVFRAGGTLIRITTHDPTPSFALADLLAGEGLAVPRALSIDVLVDDGLWASAWPWLEPDPARAVDAIALGRSVRTLHELDVHRFAGVVALADYGSFPWLAIGPTLSRIEHAGILSAAELDALALAHEDLSDWWQFASTHSRFVVCHGDVQPGNVIVTAKEQLLIDWDSICLGPPQLDHAPLMTWEERWNGTPGMYAKFAKGYRRDYRDDPVAVMLADARNLVATINMVAKGITDRSAAQEGRRRVRYWLNDPLAPRWIPQ